MREEKARGPGPDPARTPANAASWAEAVADLWIGALPQSGDRAERPPELLSAYRKLAVTLLDGAASPAGRAAGDGPGTPANLLARVTAVTRRSGIGMAQAFDDMTRLTPHALDWLRFRGTHATDGSSYLVWDAVDSVVHAVSDAMRRLSYLMEETESRAHRERDDELAATTEMLSHELRNRLGAARTASQMALDSSVELDRGQLARALEIVERSLDDALRTTEDVRALAAARTDFDAVPPRPIALPLLIRSVADQLELTAQEAGVELIVDPDPVQCLVDAARLRLILFNLIGNGIKYRDGAKERPRVWVDTRSLDGDRVEVEIRDNGKGIPPKDLDHIFEYQVRGTDVAAVRGSGLGLAIAHEAVEQVGGEISVRSVEGKGSTFKVTCTVEGHDPGSG